jgi:hypothetical protein
MEGGPSPPVLSPSASVAPVYKLLYIRPGRPQWAFSWTNPLNTVSAIIRRSKASDQFWM